MVHRGASWEHVITTLRGWEDREQRQRVRDKSPEVGLGPLSSPGITKTGTRDTMPHEVYYVCDMVLPEMWQLNLFKLLKQIIVYMSYRR